MQRKARLEINLLYSRLERELPYHTAQEDQADDEQRLQHLVALRVQLDVLEILIGRRLTVY